MSAVLEDNHPFLSVKQVAQYLQLNEKKVYTLVHEGSIPATKVTGKWMFPRELVDRWMLDSAHGGLLCDRLVIAGSDDPLLYRLVLGLTQEAGARALVSYTPTGTRLGLELLQSGRADLCGLHWGPDIESRTRHPALLKQYSGHRRWILIHAFRREQGILLGDPEQAQESHLAHLFQPDIRWALRQRGAGAQRYLLEVLSR
ncbi:MAG TPA: helix-turn-helix domain-containing protein, partial [Chromatiaceae bacterium]|nr:helix-turn-helix domain-containing protein [Chromatiaceae bacterium]